MSDITKLLNELISLAENRGTWIVALSQEKGQHELDRANTQYALVSTKIRTNTQQIENLDES